MKGGISQNVVLKYLIDGLAPPQRISMWLAQQLALQAFCQAAPGQPYDTESPELSSVKNKQKKNTFDKRSQII